MAPFEPRPESSFVPKTFSRTSSIKQFSAGTERFGHANDISKLWEGTDSQQGDYIEGIIAGSLFILSVFVVWSMVLIALKSLGKRVGCASGTPRRPSKPEVKRASRVDWNVYSTGEKMDSEKVSVQMMENVPSITRSSSDMIQNAASSGGGEVLVEKAQLDPSCEGPIDGTTTNAESNNDESSGGIDMPKESDHSISKEVDTDDDDDDDDDDNDRAADEEYEQAMEEWRHKVKRHERRLMLSRIVFLYCGVAIIVSSVLFVVLGVGHLFVSLGDGSDTVERVENIIYRGIDASNDFLKGEANARNATDSFLNSSVVGNSSSLFCEGVIDNLTIEEIRDETQKLVLALRDLSTFRFLLDTVHKVRNDLESSLEMTESVNGTLNGFGWLFICSTIAMGILDIIVIALMVSVIMAWKKQHDNRFLKYMRNIVVLPIFVFFLFLFWLFASLFLIMAVGGSDFCYDPDKHSRSLLEKNKDMFESIVYGFIYFYITGCVEEKPPDFDKISKIAASVIGLVHDLVEDLSKLDKVPDLTDECRYAVDILAQTANRIHMSFHFLYDAVFNLQDIFECSSFHPLYSGVMYDAVCINGVNGLVWIFSTALTMAVSCMVMVTLRAAWYEVENEEAAEEEKEAVNASTKSSLPIDPTTESTTLVVNTDHPSSSSDLEKKKNSLISSDPIVETGVPAEEGDVEEQEPREVAVREDHSA